MSRGKILASTIHKGGAGKTTIAVNLTHFAREKGMRTLLLDLDPQGNASDGFMDTHALPEGIELASNLFEERDSLPIHYLDKYLAIIPSDGDALQAVERLPHEAALTFRKRLHEIARSFDIVIIDTPPTMGFCMLAPLIAADFAFAPIVPDAYGMKGVVSLMERVAQVRDDINPDLVFLGMLINLWNRRDKDQNETVEQFNSALGEFVIPYQIGLRAPISQAARRKEPVWKQTRGVAAKEVKNALSWIIDQMQFELKAAA